MKVRVYVDGCSDMAVEYDKTAESAARLFAEDNVRGTSADIVVVPLDEDAIANHLWKSDGDGMFLLFRASARVEWSIDRVKTFGAKS